ncbi:MAG: hypothetical protein CVT81_07135 [Alphaproteobacteria bacterium HGW-Alphaproteobacteria-3]|nr:MAG: hypothetical protein CVT81_07135 [Alphaproteobacteria bacterium HGW-Alphaproteobacteria-3]
MNDNSSLRYLGEAYDGVRFHVEPLWAALGSDAALQAYMLMAAAGFAIYGLMTVFRSLRGFAHALRGVAGRP